MDTVELLCKIVALHLIGDYVLQSDYLATTKGKDWYSLFIHCVLYCVPFAFVFGFSWKILVLFLTHVIIDPLKARWKVINLAVDQGLHYLIAVILFMLIK